MSKRTALVLCGGGSRGALEIGFYRALVEIGVRIDLITGASVGALNGAFIAGGASATELAGLWREITFRKLFRLKLSSLFGLHRSDSLYDNDRLRRFLERHLPIKTFAELRIPLAILATDLEAGESLHLDQGDLIEAVLASVAIPGLLPPVELNGRRLIDGGITNNLPLDVAVLKGATTTLSIRCRCEQTRRQPIKGIVNILSRVFDITDSAKYQLDFHRYSPHCDMRMIQPCFDFEVGLLDFNHSRMLMEMAYEATMREQAAFAHLIGETATCPVAQVQNQL